jgi:hypothetical protein
MCKFTYRMSTKLYEQICSPHQSKHSLRVNAFPEVSRLVLWFAHFPSSSQTFHGFPSCSVGHFTAPTVARLCGVEARGDTWMGKDFKGGGCGLVEGSARYLPGWTEEILWKPKCLDRNSNRSSSEQKNRPCLLRKRTRFVSIFPQFSHYLQHIYKIVPVIN